MHTAIAIIAVPLGILALLLAFGAVYQAVGTARDRHRFPPPGRLVRVNNRLMHVNVTGESTPTVVFESGMGASCLSWTHVQPAVAEFSRAVSYDRAGHGWSDPAREPRTAQQIAKELHALLDAAGVPGPYVLVGHSFGGYVSRAFAHLYREDVVGMVLVDSIHPAEWESPAPEQLRVIGVGLRYARIAAWLARLGVVRFCLARVAQGSPGVAWAAASTFGASVSSAVQRIAGEIRKLPAPILPVVRAFWSQPKNFISLRQHVAALPVSAAQAAAVSSLVDLPVVVLSGDHHAAPYAECNATWRSSHRAECKLWRVKADTGSILTARSWSLGLYAKPWPLRDPLRKWNPPHKRCNSRYISPLKDFSWIVAKGLGGFPSLVPHIRIPRSLQAEDACERKALYMPYPRILTGSKEGSNLDGLNVENPRGFSWCASAKLEL